MKAFYPNSQHTIAILLGLILFSVADPSRAQDASIPPPLPPSLSSPSQPLSTSAPSIQPPSKSEPDTDLSLSQFLPRSQLRTPDRTPSFASFPAIDLHSHFRIRFQFQPEPRDRYLEVMNRQRIAISCCLDATLGHDFEPTLNYLWPNLQDRIPLFANIDFVGHGQDPLGTQYDQWACNQPDFVRTTVEQLRQAHQRGIVGLKFFKQFGLTYRHADGRLWEIDDPQLAPIFDLCASLRIPVIMHTADPSAFFLPVDAKNERFEELHRHPDWAFPSPPFPSRESLHAARSRLIARHPNTQFIAAHLGNDGEDLEQCESWLQQHPNLYLEFASRISELGRQPFTAQRFLERHADRLLLGTDGPWPEPRLQLYWRFLETNDEYFPYSEKTPPPQGLWQIYGVQLSHRTLKKIYHENACQLIPTLRPLLKKWQAQHPLPIASLPTPPHLQISRLACLLVGLPPTSVADLQSLQRQGVTTIFSLSPDPTLTQLCKSENITLLTASPDPQSQTTTLSLADTDPTPKTNLSDTWPHSIVQAFDSSRGIFYLASHASPTRTRAITALVEQGLGESPALALEFAQCCDAAGLAKPAGN